MASAEDDGSQAVAIPDLNDPTEVTDSTIDDSANDSQGQVAGSADGLPNTGPEEAILPALALGLLVWQILKYRDSRCDLIDSFKLS